MGLPLIKIAGTHSIPRVRDEAPDETHWTGTSVSSGIEVEDDGVEVFGDLLGYARHSLDLLEGGFAHALDAAEVLEELLAALYC